MNPTDLPCPACGAQDGHPCDITIDGAPVFGWSHDARILAHIDADMEKPR